MKTEFIVDCLKNYWCLEEVATKYNMTIDEVIDKYHQEAGDITYDDVKAVATNMFGGK